LAAGRVVGGSDASRLDPSTHAECSQHPAVRIELLIARTHRRTERVDEVERGPSGEGRPARAERPPAVSLGRTVSVRSATPSANPPVDVPTAQPRDDEETFTGGGVLVRIEPAT
jgi:hypothetical protein